MAGTLSLAGQINRYHRETIKHGNYLIQNALKVGELLTQQKEAIGPGGWLKWVEGNCDFSRRSASTYMKLWSDSGEFLSQNDVSLLDETKTLKGLSQMIAQPEKSSDPPVEEEPEIVEPEGYQPKHPDALEDGNEPCPKCQCIYWVPMNAGDAYRCDNCDHLLGVPDGLAESVIEMVDAGELEADREQLSALAECDETTQESLVEDVQQGRQTLDQAIESGVAIGPQAEERMKADNGDLESWCRELRKIWNQKPDHPWFGYLGCFDTAEQQFTSALGTVRSAKGYAICSGCDGAGCDLCHQHGYVPRKLADQIST